MIQTYKKASEKRTDAVRFWLSVSFFPKTVYVNQSNIKKIELNNFVYYESIQMCGYGYSPCTHYLNQKLKSKKYFNYKAVLTD